MKLDNSRYVAFRTNPERYRLIYESKPAGFEGEGRGIAPVGTPFALARGSAMHIFIEGWNKGWTSKQIDAKIKESEIEPKAVAVGKALFQSFKQRYELDDRYNLDTIDNLGIESFVSNLDDFKENRKASEVQFELPLPGSPHTIVGRMDEIIRFDSKLYVGDYKSANAKTSENKKKLEYNLSSQPLFYLNAAKLMGLDVEGMLYRVITEHNPPQHYAIKVKKNEATLTTGILAIHQTCEEIEMLRNTFGTEVPWAHFPQTFPCNWEGPNGKSYCEYSDICNIPSSQLGEIDLERFKIRQDHLGLKSE